MSLHALLTKFFRELGALDWTNVQVASFYRLLYVIGECNLVFRGFLWFGSDLVEVLWVVTISLGSYCLKRFFF